MMITGVDRRMGYLTRCDHYTHLPPAWPQSSSLLIGCRVLSSPSHWLNLTKLTWGTATRITLRWGAPNLLVSLLTDDGPIVKTKMIFLCAKVVQSINQKLISRYEWFIGHATNWAFYQETKCGNTEILSINLFI